MRIIRGKFQRRQITAPSNLPVRTTTDMAKESLFYILENHVDFEDMKDKLAVVRYSNILGFMRGLRDRKANDDEK